MVCRMESDVIIPACYNNLTKASDVNKIASAGVRVLGVTESHSVQRIDRYQAAEPEA